MVFLANHSLIASETTPSVVLQKIGPARLLANVPQEDGLVLVKFSSVFELAVEVDGDRGLEVDPPATWTESAGWKVKNVEPPTITPLGDLGEGRRWRQTFVLDPTAPAVAPVEIKPLRYRNADGHWHTIDSWPPIAVKIVVQVQDPDLKNLRDHPTAEEVPEPPPSDFAREYLISAVLTGSVILAWILIMWRRGRAFRAAGTRTCTAIALYELTRLDALALPEKGLTGEFHTLLANVVRRYLEKRYQFPARRLTTQEFSPLLEATTLLTAEQKAFLHVFLHQCDLAKFAGGQLPAQKCRELLREAQAFLATAGAANIP